MKAMLSLQLIQISAVILTVSFLTVALINLFFQFSNASKLDFPMCFEYRQSAGRWSISKGPYYDCISFMLALVNLQSV